MSFYKEQFNVINNYFIGPKASNLPDFRANINTILDELLEARLNYYPEDNDRKFISQSVRRSEEFQRIRNNFSDVIRRVSQLLGERSVPFWSPRYQGHMNGDLTMPSLLGYFMTMLYNFNNVALESSPFTTVAELKVGQQLAQLFGYNIDEREANLPLSWGHITCDGSVANLESIWVARNLKFYPLALSQAITKGKLQFIADRFKVYSSQAKAHKLFRDLGTWELLNLHPQTILGLGDELSKQFGISSDYLTDALEEFNIQSVGRGPLERAHNITRPIKYFVAKTRHYSWPKGAAIAGIGSENMVGIDVDLDARIDLDLLEQQLRKCAEEQTAVYAVVAIVGSTEEGAVDRLAEIVKLRDRMQEEEGLTFLVHADAAWGGYFATMLDKSKEPLVGKPPSERLPTQGPIPALCLKANTEIDIAALKEADSITVDPHKAGYVPYPAGSLVYRDGRMRHLVTWSAPVLSQGSADNIGIYGVEGSKPGAAAMSAWLSNQTIGLDPNGYGALLGEAAFTSGRLSANYAALTTTKPGANAKFVCVPFNMLPSERGQGGKAFLHSPNVEAEREWIRENIIGKENSEIMGNPRIMDFLREIGSDLNINCFALNWYHPDGRLNTDLEEANYLMKRVVDRLSVTSVDSDPSKIPLFLTSTQFEPDLYGECAKNFMDRLGLHRSDSGLFVIRNVVMSPWPTQNGFIQEIMDELKNAVNEEVEVCRVRNMHGVWPVFFLMQGTDEVFLVLQTSFHAATLRQQVIVVATLDDKLMEKYVSCKTESPETALVLGSEGPLDLQKEMEDLNQSGSFSFTGTIFDKTKMDPIMKGTVTVTRVIRSRALNSANREHDYPANNTPFYLYGTSDQIHIMHMLLRAPNVSLSAGNITFTPPLPDPVTSDLPKGLVLTLDEVPEAAMQPVSRSTADPYPCFRPGQELKVSIFHDPKGSQESGPGLLENLGPRLWEGKMTLGKEVDVDADWPNRDYLENGSNTCDFWQQELDNIGNVLSRPYKGEQEQQNGCP
ncbi:pyridoxal phosphate-dependent transferase [Aspergillus egyptiacus]|nr:pyridoxal phosphate-dependent transferase [Aspergillus egyptiacus]